MYAEFKQPLSEIASAESGIKVRRVIVPAESQGRGKAQAKVGEKVKVWILKSVRKSTKKAVLL